MRPRLVNRLDFACVLAWQHADVPRAPDGRRYYQIPVTLDPMGSDASGTPWPYVQHSDRATGFRGDPCCNPLALLPRGSAVGAAFGPGGLRVELAVDAWPGKPWDVVLQSYGRATGKAALGARPMHLPIPRELHRTTGWQTGSSGAIGVDVAKSEGQA